MALVETYVDPDGTGDYTSLNAWEAAEQTDLVTDGDSHKVWCESSSGSADTTAVEINGWTTVSSNTITIQAADGHRASTEWDATKYRLSVDGNEAFKTSDQNTILDGLQIEAYSDSSLTYRAVRVSYSGRSATIKNSYIRAIGTTNTTYRALEINDYGGTTVVNTVIEAQGLASSFAALNIGVSNNASNKNTFYNCTIISDASDCVYGGNTVDVFTNVIAYHTDSGTCFPATSFVGDYNYSSDATAPGANSLTNQSDPFTDSANGDFSLASGVNAIDAGIGPSSDANVPATDINGNTRSGTTCDIGAAEYVAAVTTILTNYYYTHLMQGGL